MGGREQQVCWPPERGPQSVAIPAWVHSLGAAVWVSGPDRRIEFINRRAQELLDVGADGVAACCDCVVAGADVTGRPFCSPRCPMLAQAEDGGELQPVTLQVRGRGGAVRWVRLLLIPIAAPDGAGFYLVHCALNADRDRRFERYLTKVATRSACGAGTSRREPLTPREGQILRHLANDEDPWTIARRLHLSHVTVRNHVQHLLGKLGVHSIQEAIARHLLEQDR